MSIIFLPFFLFWQESDKIWHIAAVLYGTKSPALRKPLQTQGRSGLKFPRGQKKCLRLKKKEHILLAQTTVDRFLRL